MKNSFFSMLIMAAFLAACVVVPGRHGAPVLVPLLPPLVVLDAEPYYVQGGFHYHYDNGSWFYATSRSGPWLDLPRDHYPREVRYRGEEGNRGRGDQHEQEKGHDNRR